MNEQFTEEWAWMAVNKWKGVQPHDKNHANQNLNKVPYHSCQTTRN